MTVGFRAVHQLPDGRVAEVDTDVLGIARRLNEGDPTLGWPGDPDLGLVWNEIDRVFEVWHTSVTGEAYKVCDHHRCDADLIRKVVQADNRHASVFDRIRRENERIDREREAYWDDWHANHWVPKARWALRRDAGWDTPGSVVSLGTKR